MKLRDMLSFVAFGVITAFAVGYIGSLGVRIGLPSHRTNISMKVADVNSLVVDSNVLLRGVPVGHVTKIESAIDGATVDFYIDDHVAVPVDCDVRLDNLSALGESYIGLFPRSAHGPMFRDGQRIATESIVQPPSISELATSVVRVLNQLEPGALEHIIGEADAALPDANMVLPNLSRTSLLVRNVAADMHGRGRALLDNFQTLLRNAGWVGPVLADTAPSIRLIGQDAQVMWWSVIRLLYNGAPQFEADFKHLIDRIQGLLDNNGGDLKVLGEALRPHIKGIAGALLNFDPSQILGNILASVPKEGAITLHVTIPPR
jgi:virulence factor Mce-like protein